MKFTIHSDIFEQFPDLSVGLLAVKGIDNLTQDNEIELFLRHASLEAGLLLRMKPLHKDASILAYREALAKISMEDHVPEVEAVFKEFEDGIEEEAKRDAEGARPFVPGSTTGLVGVTALPRKNPVMDLMRGATLQFRLPVLAFDVGRDEKPVEWAFKDGEPVITVGGETAVRHFFCEIEKAGAVDEESRNLLVVIPSFAVNRRKAMSVRNELARRIKDSFGRDTEAAWVDAKQPEFISQI